VGVESALGEAASSPTGVGAEGAGEVDSAGDAIVPALAGALGELLAEVRRRP